MHSFSLLLLLGAAGIVAIGHSILPDHWVPLAVVARTQRWSLLQVGKITFLSSLGHVLASLVLSGIIAVIGLQFQQEIDTQQGHIVGAVLVLTGLLLLIWGLIGRGPHGHTHGAGHSHPHSVELGHEHKHHDHDHNHQHEHHDHSHMQERTHNEGQPLLTRLAAIVVPFGVAASPDLTILPVALAASAVGTTAVVSVLGVFAFVTIATFIGLTLIATLLGYQIKGAWIEQHATSITSLVLIAIGMVAFVSF